MSDKRVAIHVSGIVQGVGFRPFIYNLAMAHALDGWVYNSSDGVFIEVQGQAGSVDAFIIEIETKAPPQARIESVSANEVATLETKGFKIKPSVSEKDKFQPVSPDIATCEQCAMELFDPDDRRYGYPFTNCTNCGPRFTIIEKMPYDRPLTTMRSFKMCDDCQHEYDDPGNRRFHAQPNACPVCGPEVRLMRFDGQAEPVETEEPIVATAQLLSQGHIVAIKGLGGFHLACDGTDNGVVMRLRERKHRFGKPMALMVKDLDAAGELAFIGDEEAEEMQSPHCPIVLLRRREGAKIAEGIAPGNNYLGLMLPYTPLHHILLREFNRPLVMTSGNISEEPIAMENNEAFARLGHIADYFLTHNREIYSRYDDSVVRFIDGERMVIRRARGLAPEPILLDFTAQKILACGPELKNTFCLTRDKHAFVSQHIGDLENLETLEHYERTIALYESLFDIKPDVIAYDLHPEYLSTKYAMGREASRKVGVGHHHAHIAACMAENKKTEPVIGIAFDGTGYGLDGTLWGGEFLISTRHESTRAAHLQTVRLPGGAAAIDNPYRIALSYLHRAYGKNYLRPHGGLWDNVTSEEEKIIVAQIENGINAPMTSSCGRLFDAVSALIGIRHRVDYEGQAAIEMEMAITKTDDSSYKFAIIVKDSVSIIETDDIIKGVMDDLADGVSTGVIAARFHETVVRFTVKMCLELKRQHGLREVALSGGVFQNAWLWSNLNRALQDCGFEVIKHIALPPNDGCISFGQAVAASAT